MALNIKNPETHRLAQELARKTGKSVTEAVTDALRDELKKVDDRQSRLARIKEIAETIRNHAPKEWLEWDYNADLYDERGLPK